MEWGKLHPDDRAPDRFPEYASLCSGDARWSRLRVGHVLSMNTGHAACVMPQAAFSQDGVRAFFEAPLSHEPGTFFAYNTAASYLAAELARRAAGRTVPELLARTVFPALGVEGLFVADLWQTDGARAAPGCRHPADDVAEAGPSVSERGRVGGTPGAAAGLGTYGCAAALRKCGKRHAGLVCGLRLSVLDEPAWRLPRRRRLWAVVCGSA